MVDGQPERRVLSRTADNPANFDVSASTSRDVGNPFGKRMSEISGENRKKKQHDTAYRVIIYVDVSCAFYCLDRYRADCSNLSVS